MTVSSRPEPPKRVLSPSGHGRDELVNLFDDELRCFRDRGVPLPAQDRDHAVRERRRDLLDPLFDRRSALASQQQQRGALTSANS